MDAYSLHLAMAALVGASLVAVFAYHMHRKTLNQFLEFAKSVEKDLDREENSEADSPRCLKKRQSHGPGTGNEYFRRGSASLPDVILISGGADGDYKRNGPVPLDEISAGLPRLHTLTGGIDANNKIYMEDIDDFC